MALGGFEARFVLKTMCFWVWNVHFGGFQTISHQISVCFLVFVAKKPTKLTQNGFGGGLRPVSFSKPRVFGCETVI